jgi:hypothetical protein
MGVSGKMTIESMSTVRPQFVHAHLCHWQVSDSDGNETRQETLRTIIA